MKAKYAIIRTYWRDNRDPFPGRLTEVRRVKLPMASNPPPEQIATASDGHGQRTEIEMRRYRNFMRKLTPRQRRFVSVLRHVVESVPGPENLQREKIMKALKIKDRMYRHIKKTLPL